jgi:hypothetical protein
LVDLQFNAIQQNPCYKFITSAMNIVRTWMLMYQCLQLTHDNGWKQYTLRNITFHLNDKNTTQTLKYGLYYYVYFL